MLRPERVAAPQDSADGLRGCVHRLGTEGRTERIQPGRLSPQDFRTAHWAELPYTLLSKVSNRIINEVRGINRVVYDISGKPPATIEWE